MESLINLRFSDGYKGRKALKTRRNMLFHTYNIDGISSENEYVPIGAPKMNLGIYNGKVVHYSIPMSNGAIRNYMSSYSRLYSALGYNTLPFKFKTKSMPSPLTGVKGILFKELDNRDVNILLLIAVRTEYMKKMFSETNASHEPRDMSKFAIIISKEFYTSAEYKTVHNKFQREVIKPLIEKGVELIITNNIEEKCFKNGVVKPKFRSVTEMKEYLSSFNTAI